MALATAGVAYLLLTSPQSLVSRALVNWDAPVSSEGTSRVFVVRPGQSALEIGEELERQGLIRSALAFRILAESRGLSSSLAAGEYELSPSMTTGEIVDILGHGRVRPGPTVTIIEGWRVEQVARKLEQVGAVRADEFLRVVADVGTLDLDSSLRPPSGSLEGYLFPDTYQLLPSMTSAEIARMMVKQLEAKFSPAMREAVARMGWTPHQAIILASIIEREAAAPSERGLISAVFHNRLRAGMPLQADATVQYAVANRDIDQAANFDFWKGELTPEDLAIDSPYNTYRMPGLPPGPICSPGLASLEAAIFPPETDFLYFVSRGDGSHVFARTLQEHLENTRKYR